MSDDRTALHRLDQIAKALDMTLQDLIASLDHRTLPGESVTCGPRHQELADELVTYARTIADPRMKQLLLKVAHALDAV